MWVVVVAVAVAVVVVVVSLLSYVWFSLCLHTCPVLPPVRRAVVVIGLLPPE